MNIFEVKVGQCLSESSLCYGIENLKRFWLIPLIFKTTLKIPSSGESFVLSSLKEYFRKSAALLFSCDQTN